MNTHEFEKEMFSGFVEKHVVQLNWLFFGEENH